MKSLGTKVGTNVADVAVHGAEYRADSPVTHAHGEILPGYTGGGRGECSLPP